MKTKKPKENKYGAWLYEVSLDNLPADMVEKVVAEDVFHDPVFSVVAAGQELLERSHSLSARDYAVVKAVLDESDSTVVNRFWALDHLHGWQVAPQSEHPRVIHGESHSMRTCHDEETRTAGAGVRAEALPDVREEAAIPAARAAVSVRWVRMEGRAT